MTTRPPTDGTDHGVFPGEHVYPETLEQAHEWIRELREEHYRSERRAHLFGERLRLRRELVYLAAGLKIPRSDHQKARRLLREIRTLAVSTLVAERELERAPVHVPGYKPEGATPT